MKMPSPAAGKLQALHRLSRETVITLLAVILFTAVVLLVAGAPPLAACQALFKGSLGSWIKFSHVIKAWIPLTLCGCGLLFTFRIGLWNIGVEGQVMMGAVFTTGILRLGIASGVPGIFVGLSFAAAAVGGGLWALAAGLLKTRGGVHEIFAGLGMNFVAQALILWVIFGPWRRTGVASMSGTELFPQGLWLAAPPAWRFSPVGLGLALAALAITALLLGYTRMGLRLKAIGSNARAAVLFGIEPDRYLLLAMLLAGGFAGLAGSLQVSGVYHRLLPAISSNYGYLALLVVMLANYNIRLVPVVALFFACLNVGSIQLPMVLNVDSSLSGVVQGVLVLATLGVQAWRTRRGPERQIHQPGRRPRSDRAIGHE
jgi:general nucleoside transport system permease protein